MYFGLVHYPKVIHKGFQAFRQRYDPYYELMQEHVTLIHPVPEIIGRGKIEGHILQVLEGWKPFDVHFHSLEKSRDHWLYLGAGEGNDSVIELHDRLYEGILRPYLREDLPFYTHIGLGLVSKEAYDFNDPTAELTLDTEKFYEAKEVFDGLEFDLWCTINTLTLVRVNSEFTECNNLRTFFLSEISGFDQ